MTCQRGYSSPAGAPCATSTPIRAPSDFIPNAASTPRPHSHFLSSFETPGSACASTTLRPSAYAGQEYQEADFTDGESDYTDQSLSSFPEPSLEYKAESLMPEPKCDVCTSARSKSFGGKDIFDPSGMGKTKFEPWIEKNTSWKRGNESSSIIGPHLDMEETGYDFSDPERRKLGFDPYVHMYELRKFASPYKNFAPCQASTPHNAPMPDRRSKKAWKSPERELSYARASTPPSSPCGTKTVHPGLKPDMSSDSATAGAIKHLLDDMEWKEMSKIKRDLRDFQKARRRLIFDATHIKPL